MAQTPYLSHPYTQLPALYGARLRDYVERHRTPGDFLVAVLKNDLRAALRVGSAFEVGCLPTLVDWLDENLPDTLWGGPEVVDAWLEPTKGRGGALRDG